MNEGEAVITETGRRIMDLTGAEAKVVLMILADWAGGDGQHRIDAAIDRVLEQTRDRPR